MDGDVVIAPPYGITDVSGENEEHVKEVKERVGFCEEDKCLVIKYEVVLIYLLKQSLCSKCYSQTTNLFGKLFIFPLGSLMNQIQFAEWHNNSIVWIKIHLTIPLIPFLLTPAFSKTCIYSIGKSERNQRHSLLW